MGILGDFWDDFECALGILSSARILGDFGDSNSNFPNFSHVSSIFWLARLVLCVFFCFLVLYF